MSKSSHKNDDVAIQNLFVYNLPEKILNSLELMHFDTSVTEVRQGARLTESNLNQHTVSQLEVDSTIEAAIQESHVKSKTASLSAYSKEIGNVEDCSACKISLVGLPIADIRDHYKSDFHRFNLKRTINGLGSVTEAEFEKLVDDLDESISGSESDLSESSDVSEKKIEKLDTIFERIDVSRPDTPDEEEDFVSFMNTKSPYIYFRSSLIDSQKCLGIYKSTFNIKEIQTPLEAIKNWNSKKQPKVSALFMIGGGHFAGAIISHQPKNIKGNTSVNESALEQSVDLVAHKTFHRYTTRRKQGGAQGTSDNARGAANSAGSSLRRHNEDALKAEVRELLKSWERYLENCQSIFIRANGSYNRGYLVGYEGAVLRNDDVRIRGFPFTTKRATTAELKRAWVALSYLDITDVPKPDERLKKKLLQREKNLKNSTQVSQKEVRELSANEKYSVELVNFIKKSRAPLLINFIRKNKISPNFKLEPESEYSNFPTLLHFAAYNGSTHIVHVLLNSLKADPTISSTYGKTSYDTSQNKQTKRVFQIARFNLGESYCDWKAAHVGEPKSKEEFEKEEETSKLADELMKKKLIQAELDKIEEEVIKRNPTISSSGKLSDTFSRVDELSGLSDEQKMRIMREQRARAAEARFRNK